MSVVNAVPLLAAAGGDYQISRSVRLRSSASAYFNRTNSGTVTNNKVFTYSAWVKRGSFNTTTALLSGDNATAQHYFGFGVAAVSADNLEFYDAQTAAWRITTNALYRDPSAWYHVILSVDTTQATAANRVRIYVNGSECSYATASYPAQNTVPNINVASMGLYIGRRSNVSQWYLDGYLTEVNFIDGQALTPSSFGETDAVTGVWKPKKYAGTYGTNGFYLNFSDNSAATAAAIGKDYSGNGNNWTPNNISVTAGVTYDSMLDSPTPYADGGNGRGNYCVLNPLQTTQSASVSTNGNLTSPANTGVWRRLGATMQAPTTGKFYFEYVCDSYTSFPTFSIGIFNGAIDTSNNAIGSSATEWGYNAQSGYATNNNTNISSGFTTATTGDVLQLAYDASTGSLWFGKNNTWQGAGSPNPATGTSPTYTGVYNVTPVMVQNWATQSANFGQRPFTYTPPTGFKALNTQNLPDATITKGSKHFDVSTYTGNGSTQSITGVAFQPDFVWAKSRSQSGFGHLLFDSVRGVGNYLQSSGTGAEANDSTMLTAFNSNGFSVGSSGYINGSTYTFVGWQWKAGGTAVSNTAGSITSQVSANASAGFSVVTWTGNGSAGTVGHGLGVAPKMVIYKRRTSNAADNWVVYHSGIASSQNGGVYLNLTNAWNSDSTLWNNTAPASSVFSIGGYASPSGYNMVAYCFSEVAGFSKFGSYTPNNSADGPFVYLGFRAKYLLIKGTTGASGWYIYDTVRQTYNAMTADLRADLSNAEPVSSQPIDILSNGFKVRTTDTNFNSSSYGPYIFMAFAEVPFRNALAR